MRHMPVTCVPNEMDAHGVYSYEMHARETYAHKTHVHEMHAHEMYAHKAHVHEIHAYEVHAHEVYPHEMHIRKVLGKILGSPTLQMVAWWLICQDLSCKTQVLRQQVNGPCCPPQLWVSVRKELRSPAPSRL
jgi:hypothetical protein